MRGGIGLSSISNVQTANGQVSSQATQSSSVSSVPGGALGQNAFLQLLAMQMKYQDPLAPQSNSQFVAQLAQFSTLEQMTNVSAEEQTLISAIGGLTASSQMASATGLLGDTVSVTGSGGSIVSGVVTAVASANGQVMLTVAGTQYQLGAVTSVSK